MPLSLRRPLLRFATLLLAFVGLSLDDACHVAANERPFADETTIQLIDGRLLLGSVDHRTNEQHLWLTKREPGLTVISRFAWDQVLGASSDGSFLTREQFRTQIQTDFANAARDNDSEDSAGDSTPPPTANPGSRVEDPEVALVAACEDCLPHKRAPLIDPRAVRTLHLEARLANWDDDVEPDGIRVLVAPLDWNGHVVPINALINFRLLAERQRYTGGTRVRRRPQFARTGDWTKRIRVEHFGPDGAFYELPFRNFHPQRDYDFSAEGLLTARLSVSGVGVFNASTEFLLLRPPSFVRDNAQLGSGRRYLSDEFTRLRPPRLPGRRAVTQR